MVENRLKARVPGPERLLTKVARFNVDFSDDAIAVLDELARRQNTTKAEVLRRAINLEKWFMETNDTGGKVLVEKDGVQREVIKL